MYKSVTPAKAGVQSAMALRYWIPAFAGMTGLPFVINVTDDSGKG